MVMIRYEKQPFKRIIGDSSQKTGLSKRVCYTVRIIIIRHFLHFRVETEIL